MESYCHAIARACEVAFAMPLVYREPRGEAAAAETREAPLIQQQRREHRASLRAAWRRQHVWHPHQLRHNAATHLRKEYGLEAAQVILGHKTLAATEIYAEKNQDAARKIMAAVG